MRFRLDDLPSSFRQQAEAQLAAYTQGELPGIIRRTCRREPNKTEARYRAEVLARRGDLGAVHYEGLTLRMANGHRYTADWVVVTKAGQVECHEVKGSHALGSHQRARLAFDQARVEFPWVVWIWAVRTKNGWKIGG